MSTSCVDNRGQNDKSKFLQFWGGCADTFPMGAEAVPTFHTKAVQAAEARAAGALATKEAADSLLASIDEILGALDALDERLAKGSHAAHGDLEPVA